MENQSSTRIEIVKELDEYVDGDIEEEMFIKFEELCQSYLLKPAEIVCEWVAFAANKHISPEPNFENVSQFEREHLSKKLTKTPIRNMKNITTPRRYASTKSAKKEFSGTDVLDNYNTPEQYYTGSKKRQMTPETPPAIRNSAFSPGLTNSKYESRTSKGDVICNWGETSTCSWISNGLHSVSVQHYDNEQALTSRYQFMFEKLKDRAFILNDILQDTASFFKKEHQIDEWNDFCLPSPNEMTVVGRIDSDSNGKLNSSSILLEGSIETCSGKTIHLDISKLSNYAFYPGQIIAGKGKNLLGKALLMSSLFEPVYLPFPEKMPASKTENLQMVIAAGPFTTVDNLSFEPLRDLLKYVTDSKPHVCILIGPLVDSKQEIEINVLEEELAVTYQKIFSQIEEAKKESNTNIVIVSSSNDILQDYIYPTPPYGFTRENHKVQFVSDPSVLSIDGVVIGITAMDIIFHLSKEELSSPGSTDRLGRLAGHILSQRSFYPLYPPNENVNIDYGHFETYAKLPVMPHILILPSDLRCFIKNINGCLCINPERLTKGAGGGNFARIEIDIDNCNKTSSGSIADYIKGEIVKI